MKSLTTLQVRSHMRSVGINPAYTNKSINHQGAERRVKAWCEDLQKVEALKLLCGADNVQFYDNRSKYTYIPNSVTVKCKLA